MSLTGESSRWINSEANTDFQSDAANAAVLKRNARLEDIVDISRAISKLRAKYPGIRSRGKGPRTIDVHSNIILPRFVQSHREYLGQLSANEIQDDFRKDVPSLMEPQDITTTWVDVMKDPHSGTAYVVIVPHAFDILEMCRERYNSHHSVFKTSGTKPKIVFPQPMPALTVANVPVYEGAFALDEAVGVAESFMPLPVRLLPALGRE